MYCFSVFHIRKKFVHCTYVARKAGVKLKLAVGFRTDKVKVFLYTLYHQILIQKVISIYNTKYNDHLHFQLFGTYRGFAEDVSLSIILVCNQWISYQAFYSDLKNANNLHLHILSWMKIKREPTITCSNINTQKMNFRY